MVRTGSPDVRRLSLRTCRRGAQPGGARAPRSRLRDADRDPRPEGGIGVASRGRLEDKAVRGVAWTVLVFAGGKIVTFGATLVLARILDPSDFGLVAIASVTIGLPALFSDLGLGGALVVRKDLSDRTAGTILTLMLVMGAVTAVVIAAATRPSPRRSSDSRI